MRLPLLIAVALAAVLLATGCGGSNARGGYITIGTITRPIPLDVAIAELHHFFCASRKTQAKRHSCRTHH